jgi:hypothetical protein
MDLLAEKGRVHVESEWRRVKERIRDDKRYMAYDSATERGMPYLAPDPLKAMPCGAYELNGNAYLPSGLTGNADNRRHSDSVMFKMCGSYL